MSTVGENERGSPEPSTAGLPSRMVLAFAPLHKRAFGVAVGVACGLIVAVGTVMVVLRDAERVLNLGLLVQYFYGYTVSWRGVFLGFGWAFIVGFTAGWFVAFARNLVVAISLFLVRTRAELQQTRDFMDHI